MPTWPPGDGEMARRIRDHAWAATPLGPLAAWPQSLRTAVEIMLGCGFPSSVSCGSASIYLYNDAAIRVIGDRHPRALGRPAFDTFPEGAALERAQHARVLAGETLTYEELEVTIDRGHGPRPAYFVNTRIPVRDEVGSVVAQMTLALDVTAQREAEAAMARASEERARAVAELRRSEARQAYLLSLADAIRPLGDPVEVQRTAARILAEHMGVDRAFYCEAMEASGAACPAVVHGEHASGAPAADGRYSLERFGALADELRAGRRIAVADVEREPRITAAERLAYRRLGLGALVAIPLMKDGRLVALLAVHHSAARAWTPDELSRMEETAERTWGAVQRARAEAALRASERRLQRMVDVSRVGVLTFDIAAGTLLEANDAFLALTGYDRAQLANRELTWQRMTPPEHIEISLRQMEQLSATGRVGPYEKEYLRRDGSRSWMLFTGADIGDGTAVKYCIDVSDRKRAEEALRASLAERDTLLKEIHHRVKNNLEVIHSLLQLQAHALPDPRVRSALDETSGRVHAIAEIHRLLYDSPDLARVDIAAYAQALCVSVARMSLIDPARVRTAIDVAPLQLDVRRAMPLGLILNELLANAFKHAFPAPRAGTVRVELRSEAAAIDVRVSDDGVGLPPGAAAESLGLRLVRLLTEQLGGELTFEASAGTAVHLRFPA